MSRFDFPRPRLLHSVWLLSAVIGLVQGCATPEPSASEVVMRLVEKVEDECLRPAEIHPTCIWVSPKLLRTMGGKDEKCGVDGFDCTNIVVEVKVPPEGSKEICTAALKYSSLTLRHKEDDASKSKSVTWVLSGQPKDHFFAQDASGGVALSRPKSGTKEPPDIWKVTEATSTRHTIEVHTYGRALKAPFCHYPRVKYKEGTKDEQLCCPLDPMIINDPY